MVLEDTSVWVEHFKTPQARLVRLLQNDDVYCHPLIIAEIACGNPPSSRKQVLEDLSLLHGCMVATMQEVLTFIEENEIYGRGFGYIDIALLASTLLTENALLWTLDKRLNKLSIEFGTVFSEDQ